MRWDKSQLNLSIIDGWSTDNLNKDKIPLDYHRQLVYASTMENEELIKWRQKTGYSQGRLARVLGVDVMTVSRWERGIMQVPSFLKWALAYIELKAEEIEPLMKRKRKVKERR